MKLAKQKINSQKLLKLHLIKYKVYGNLKNKQNLNNVPNNKLSDIILNFKKALNFIYKYHKNNKKILFIGSPKEINNLINLKTIHKSLPFSCNMNLSITNKFILNNNRISKYLIKNSKSLFSEIQKKPELIVIFDHTKKHYIVKKSCQEKIPVIEFNFNRKRNDFDLFYNIQTNFDLNKNKNLNNIFFIILNSLLNKSYQKIK